MTCFSQNGMTCDLRLSDLTQLWISDITELRAQLAKIAGRKGFMGLTTTGSMFSIKVGVVPDNLLHFASILGIPSANSYQ